MADDSHSRDGTAPWLFMLGLVLFGASLALFLFDLVRGDDVLRGIGANAVAVAVLILWAALDTLKDPNSEVATPGGAAGTALLLYGLYLLAAGAVVALTGLVHPYMRLGFYYVGLAVVAVILGSVIFPSEAVIDDEPTEGDEAAEAVDDEQSAADGSSKATDEEQSRVDEAAEAVDDEQSVVDGSSKATGDDAPSERDQASPTGVDDESASQSPTEGDLATARDDESEDDEVGDKSPDKP